jgi:hypothetical protein
VTDVELYQEQSLANALGHAWGAIKRPRIDSVLIGYVQKYISETGFPGKLPNPICGLQLGLGPEHCSSQKLFSNLKSQSQST